VRVPEGELAEQVRAAPAPGRTTPRRRPAARAALEPAASRASASGVAISSIAHTGTSVFTKSWTRSSGGGAGAGPPAGIPSADVDTCESLSGVPFEHRQTTYAVSALHAVHGSPRRLPRVVGGARPEGALVPTTRGFRPTSLARCACQSRFGSSRSSHTSTR
jgi:hypothetical protein